VGAGGLVGGGVIWRTRGGIRGQGGVSWETMSGVYAGEKERGVPIKNRGREKGEVVAKKGGEGTVGVETRAGEGR